MSDHLSMAPLDQLWVLVAGALVFSMQAGFLCLEAGLSRAKHSMNVAIKNVADYVVASIAFLAIGHGLMFGRTWQGILGTSDFFFDWRSPEEAVFFFFQLAFCSCAATIVSGAVAERMKFKAYLIYSAVVSTVFYPLFGHWVWGGTFYLDQQGWLGKLGYLDFAGSSVVHQMGGWLALAGIIVLGPRLGKFDSHGRPQRIVGHNIPLALLGTFILWFGWIGFNGGSTLAMNDAVGLAVINTNTAAAAGSLVALGLGWCYRRRPDILDISNGALGGLVAITASAQYVDGGAALLIGAVAGIVVLVSGEWLEQGLKLDDVVGAVPVHGFCGLWGVLAVALFARPEFLLHPDDRWYHLGVQALGSGVCFLVAFGGGFIFFALLDRMVGLRVSPKAEREGLNSSEHQIVSGISRLAQTMRVIAESKDWSQRTSMDPYEDAGELGEHFNALLETTEQTVNELKQAHSALDQRADELEQRNKELEDFTRIVSHDLKEPLRSIDAFSRFVLKDYEEKLNDEGRGYLDRLRANAKRMQQLIEDFLHVSRLSRRSAELHLQAVNLNELMKEVQQQAEHALTARQAQLLIPESLPTLTCDRGRMVELFANLISNAIKYNDKPQPRVEIGGRSIDGYWEFSVKDNGPGIEAEYFDKIFEIFQRLGKKETQEGTGVGLTIVKRIVELHSGRIWVESTVGQGTTFYFTIPKALEP